MEADGGNREEDGNREEEEDGSPRLTDPELQFDQGLLLWLWENGGEAAEEHFLSSAVSGDVHSAVALNPAGLLDKRSTHRVSASKRGESSFSQEVQRGDFMDENLLDKGLLLLTSNDNQETLLEDIWNSIQPCRHEEVPSCDHSLENTYNGYNEHLIQKKQREMQEAESDASESDADEYSDSEQGASLLASSWYSPRRGRDDGIKQ